MAVVMSFGTFKADTMRQVPGGRLVDSLPMTTPSSKEPWQGCQAVVTNHIDSLRGEMFGHQGCRGILMIRYVGHCHSIGGSSRFGSRLGI